MRRTRFMSLFFLMLTLAIGEIVEQLAQSWHGVTGGSDGPRLNDRRRP